MNSTLTVVVLWLLVLSTHGAIVGFTATQLPGTGSGSWEGPYSYWLSYYDTSADITQDPPLPATYYNDGNYNDGGLYKIPQNGIYTFSANLFFEYRGTTAPNQNVNLRLVSCPEAGCYTFDPFESCGAATTLSQGANTWLNQVPSGGAYPAYNPSMSFTGYFTAGTYVGVCFYNWSYSTLTLKQEYPTFLATCWLLLNKLSPVLCPTNKVFQLQ